MAAVNLEVTKQAEKAIAALTAYAKVRAAYLFGSQTQGTATERSDVDIAAFIENYSEEWDLKRIVNTMALVQQEVGDEIELHFFPAESYSNPNRASFAEYIMKTGVPIRVPAGVERPVRM